jgi:DNA repair exonuclease SbcCD ATPase subunit
MRVLNLKVHNILKVSDLDMSMDGHHLVLIGGKNGQGKTSAIRALLMALCGKRGMDFPDVVLKEGEDHGWVKVDLSGDEDLGDLQGLTIEMGFRRRRGGKIEESFRLLDSTGEEAPEPRKLLSSLYSLRAFDPLAFEKAKPKEQAELIRRLLGLDFTDADKEYDQVFAERTQVNRQLKELEARRSAIRVPSNAPKEKVSVGTLVKELDAAREVNAKVDGEFEKLGKSDALLEKLDSDIVKARQALAKLESDFSEATIANNEQRSKCANLAKIDTSAIQAKIESSEELNAAYDLKVSADQLDKQIRETVRKADGMTDALEDIKSKKQTAMEEAKWPVPGMSLDDNGVLLDGLPFEQASRAQRIRTSVKIEMAAKPKLRLMVSQDGSDCDMDTLNELEAICKENDYQLIMEFVTRSQADEELCAVVFEDGQAK